MSHSGTKSNSVSVVIATYNRADLLREAIQSFLDQTRVPDEIIIVNDGSTDNTKEIVKQFGDQIVYLEKPNGGKSAALNIAIPHVRSTYTWIFDDDDVALPHALQTHLDFLAKNPECDFTYSTMYSFKGQFSTELLDEYEKETLPPISADEFFPWLLEAMRILMQGMLVPTSCYQDVGLFDEQLLRSQDYDMVLRLARRYRAGRIDAPTFALRSHGGARGPGFANHGEKERIRIWRQYDQRIFGRIFDELELAEFLPRGCASKDRLTSQQHRHALIQRAYVAANHGFLEQALEDFDAWAFDPNATDAPLTTAEQRLLSLWAKVDNLYFIPSARFYRRIGTAARRQPAALRWLIRGLYWSFTQHIKRPAVAAKITLLTGALLGGYIFASSRVPARNANLDN